MYVISEFTMIGATRSVDRTLVLDLRPEIAEAQSAITTTCPRSHIRTRGVNVIDHELDEEPTWGMKERALFIASIDSPSTWKDDVLDV